MMSVLEFEDLRVCYGYWEVVLGVLFEVLRGRMVGLVGELGLGKLMVA